MIDFSSNKLDSVRDGNTISNGQWLRRGLPKIPDYSPEYQVPKSKNIELVSFQKPNSDCCMFSYVEFDDDEDGMFLIATRNMSIIAQDKENLLANNGTMVVLKEIGKLWFERVEALDKKQLADLKRKLSEKTWVGEYLNEDHLVHYPGGEQIVLHSIVDNHSGKQLPDAYNIFRSFKFLALPQTSHGSFILEEEALKAKIDEIAAVALHQSLSQTQEGIVVQLIDRDAKHVIENLKVKSVEYCQFSLLS
jgi:hypothetical protein